MKEDDLVYVEDIYFNIRIIKTFLQDIDKKKFLADLEK